MKNKDKKKYTGALNKPMLEFTYPHNDGLRLSDRNIEAKNKDTGEEFDKLSLLAKHYKIDESNKHAGLLLALELARAHVPGFKRINKAGTPKVWHKTRLCELRKDVDRYKTIRKINIKQACSELSKCEPWKTLLVDKREPAEILRTQYYKIKPEDCKTDEQFWIELLQEYKKRKEKE